MRFIEYVTTRNASQKRQQINKVASIIIDLFTIPRINEVRQRAHDNTEAIWKNADSPIFQWLKTHGVNAIPGVVPPYAQGGAGRAYFLGNKVVKMSANRVEANVADMAKNRPDLPTPVIDVNYLGDNIYGILQHHVDTNVPIEIKKAADYLTMIVDDYPEMEGYPQTKNEQEKICLEILKNNGGPRTLLPYMLMILDVLVRLYHGTGFKHNDAGPTNIAMHQNQIVIPDLGPNEDGDYDTLSSLSKISQNREKLGLAKRPTI